MKLWIVAVTLNTAKQFFTIYFGLQLCIINLFLVSKGSAVQKIWLKQSCFDHMSLNCDRDLENSIPISGTTLRPTLMHHHTKFQYKRLSASEDILWKKGWTHRQTGQDRQADTEIPACSPLPPPNPPVPNFDTAGTNKQNVNRSTLTVTQQRQTHHRQLTMDNSQQTAHHRQLTTDNSQKTAQHREFTTDNSPWTTHKGQLTTDNSQRTAHHRQLTKDSSPQTTHPATQEV